VYISDEVPWNTDQVIANWQRKIPIYIFVYSSKMRLIGADMCNITNRDIPESDWLNILSIKKVLHYKNMTTCLTSYPPGQRGLQMLITLPSSAT
jgi:hypothetical protein